MKRAGEVFNMTHNPLAGQQGGEKASVCLRKTRIVEQTHCKLYFYAEFLLKLISWVTLSVVTI